MRCLAQFLTEKHPGRRFDFVLGFLSDRPLDQMIQPILPIASSITFCPVPTERGADPGELARAVRAMTHDSIPVSSAENPVTAMKSILGGDSPGLVAAGSLHFAGTVLRDIGAEPFPVGDECSLPETTGLNEYSTSLNGAFRKASSSGSAAGNP
jgi:folylpolyglutamate synthase/dihydropteroate synthase